MALILRLSKGSPLTWQEVDDNFEGLSDGTLIAASAITEAKIADGAVTTVKLGADAVTGAKIADNAVDSEHIVAGAIDTAHIGNDQVTYAKIQNVTTDRLLGRDTAASGDLEELTVGGGIEFTGSGGIQSSAFTGDVTKTVGGTALTIANDAVTFAKIQNISTGIILGRSTAASGDPEEITPDGLTISGGKIAPSRRKNAIINGDFNVWQRETSFAAIPNTNYFADRWRYINNTAVSVHTASRSTDVPTVAQVGRLLNYSALIDCTTLDATIGASDAVFISQRIEGYNWLPLAQRALTLSFWVKATKTGVYCVALVNSGNDRSYVAEYTINATDTWERKTVNILASPSAGTWDYTSGIGIEVAFALAVGSTFQTTAGAWQTGQFYATANQVNATDSASNDFRIAGVQLEAGDVATEFEQRTFQDELALCQRYYEKSYNFGTVPGTATTASCIEGHAPGGQHTPLQIIFKVTKRVTPTFTIYSTGTGASAKVRNVTTAADVGAATANEGDSAARAATTADQTEGNIIQCQWVAAAEL